MAKFRDLIDSRRNEVAKATDLLPERASEILAELSALLGNVNDEIRFRDMEYNRKFLEIRQSEESAATAKIKAQTTEEYELMREARDTKEVMLEMIRSLKYFQRAKEQEYMHTK